MNLWYFPVYIALNHMRDSVHYNTPLPLCFCGNRWVIFSIYHTSCKMMFPISYLVYSVKYFTCLLITYLVHSENYHVCLLITTRTNQSGEYNRWTTEKQRIMTINNLRPQAAPLDLGGLWTIYCGLSSKIEVVDVNIGLRPTGISKIFQPCTV